jgi:molecular chaperone DnaJ
VPIPTPVVPKDYYTILHIPPGSSFEAIKKAYRKLAMEFHPDRNRNNPYAAAHFQEVREAYEVLADPAKRESYHQQRALARSAGKGLRNSGPITPKSILQQAIRLEDRVNTAGMARMDPEIVYREIMHLSSDEVIEALKPFNDENANEAILTNLIRAAETLPYKLAMLPVPQWRKLSNNNREIDAYVQRKRQQHLVDIYKTPGIIFLALLLCWLVYKLSH